MKVAFNVYKFQLPVAQNVRKRVVGQRFTFDFLSIVVYLNGVNVLCDTV